MSAVDCGEERHDALLPTLGALGTASTAADLTAVDDTDCIVQQADISVPKSAALGLYSVANTHSIISLWSVIHIYWSLPKISLYFYLIFWQSNSISKGKNYTLFSSVII